MLGGDAAARAGASERAFSAARRRARGARSAGSSRSPRAGAGGAGAAGCQRPARGDGRRERPPGARIFLAGPDEGVDHCPLDLPARGGRFIAIGARRGTRSRWATDCCWKRALSAGRTVSPAAGRRSGHQRPPAEALEGSSSRRAQSLMARPCATWSARPSPARPGCAPVPPRRRCGPSPGRPAIGRRPISGARATARMANRTGGPDLSRPWPRGAVADAARRRREAATGPTPRDPRRGARPAGPAAREPRWSSTPPASARSTAPTWSVAAEELSPHRSARGPRERWPTRGCGRPTPAARSRASRSSSRSRSRSARTIAAAASSEMLGALGLRGGAPRAGGGRAAGDARAGP